VSIPVLDDVVAVVTPLVVQFADAVGGAAVAIVLCTIALRLLLLPLTLRAVRGERARAALAPRLRELQQRHKGDAAALGTEMTALYRGAGVSPFAGVLPMLAQAPFVMVWFRIFTTGSADLLGQRFLGAELSAQLFAHPLAFAPLVLVLALLGVVALRRSRWIAAVTGGPAPTGLFVALPFLSVLSALFLPLAAVLYVVTSVAWTTAESILLRRGLPARV
jgi:YidC/Oxa1 family membrane protein insertase